MARLTKRIADPIHRERVCRVATAGRAGVPHLVPVCQVAADGTVLVDSAASHERVLRGVHVDSRQV